MDGGVGGADTERGGRSSEPGGVAALLDDPGTTVAMATLQVTYRFVSTGPRRRRRGDPTVGLTIFTLLAIVGAAFAAYTLRHNEARARRYEADAVCTAAFALSVETTQNGNSACTVETARVADRWVHTYHSSRYYHLVLRTDDGAADSVELKDGAQRGNWMSATLGTRLPVQRFIESPPAARRHIALVEFGGRAVRTDWNPMWRAGDAISGTVSLSVTAAGSFIALLVARAQRRRRAEQLAA